MQLEGLPVGIGSPSSNTFVQWMRFDTCGLIACAVHRLDTWFIDRIRELQQ